MNTSVSDSLREKLLLPDKMMMTCTLLKVSERSNFPSLTVREGDGDGSDPKDENTSLLGGSA